jgi:tRNA-Thr(GGU) m(6)t(6)A37 methyltransferase TsaA
MQITLTPIGTVRSSRTDLRDDHWDQVTAEIELAHDLDPEALLGLEDFSHAEVLFHFDRVPEASVERRSRRPRGNPQWPQVGIFAQRGSARPNRIGATIVRILAREGRVLRVAGLDAADGTPVLDIKPVMREFLPREPVRQPSWASELMTGYWGRPRPTTAANAELDMLTAASQHVTLAEILERTVSEEAFTVAVDGLRRRVEAEGVRELLTLQFYADPHSARVGAVLTFAEPGAFLRHVALVGGWEEFRAFAACARLLDIRVYGELPAEAAGWIGQFGAIGHTFRQHITGFVRP